MLLTRYRQLFLREIDAVNPVITLVSAQKYAFPLKRAGLPNQPVQIIFRISKVGARPDQIIENVIYELQLSYNWTSTRNAYIPPSCHLNTKQKYNQKNHHNVRNPRARLHLSGHRMVERQGQRSHVGRSPEMQILARAFRLL
jgi:hypothetical protein